MDMFTQLKQLANETKDYEIPLQRGTLWNVRTACGALISANTGYGKSFFTLYLTIMFSLKNAIILAADPKLSDMASLSDFMPPNRIVWETEDIIKMTDNVVEIMMARYAYMKTERLHRGLFQADFVDFGLPAVVFIMEEMGAFVSTLSNTQRLKYDANIKNITLRGRQAGINIITILQNAGTQNITTESRSQMGLRVFLGNSGGIEYRLVFGEGFTYPKRIYKPGQGLYMLASETSIPKFIETPRLDKNQLGDTLKRALELQFDKSLESNSRSPPM